MEEVDAIIHRNDAEMDQLREMVAAAIEVTELSIAATNHCRTLGQHSLCRDKREFSSMPLRL
jgi:hypothetical protein